MKSILLLITPLEAGIDLKYLVILSPGTISHTFITAGNTRLSPTVRALLVLVLNKHNYKVILLI
jgi:hypothetical protein